MIERCTNPNDQQYERYGGRGIKVCERWRKFENFLADMGEPPPGLQIDRIDNEGDYCSSNCRWATRVQQARNKRNNRVIEYRGRAQPLAAWAEETGLNANTIRHRLNLGWSVERALTEPPKRPSLLKSRKEF